MTNTLPDLRTAQAAHERHAADEIAKANAARSAAAEILDELADLVSRRDTVANFIKKGESELRAHSERTAELEQVIRTGWENGGRGLLDEIHEVVRHDFLTTRIQGWLVQWRPVLVALDQEVVSFKERHSIK